MGSADFTINAHTRQVLARHWLEVESLKHMKPTFHGDTIRAETTVIEKKETSSGDRGIVTVETRGYNQRGEEVCFFRRKVMVPKAPAAG